MSSALSSAGYFKSHCCKQCGPRSDCSFRSSLIWIHTVCLYAKSMFEKFASRCSRRHKQTTFSDAVFLGVLKVNIDLYINTVFIMYYMRKGPLSNISEQPSPRPNFDPGRCSQLIGYQQILRQKIPWSDWIPRARSGNFLFPHGIKGSFSYVTDHFLLL